VIGGETVKACLLRHLGVPAKAAEMQQVSLFSTGHNQPNSLGNDFQVDPKGTGFNIFQVEF
jgi:hypothetical protein